MGQFATICTGDYPGAEFRVQSLLEPDYPGAEIAKIMRLRK